MLHRWYLNTESFLTFGIEVSKAYSKNKQCNETKLKYSFKECIANDSQVPDQNLAGQ